VSEKPARIFIVDDHPLVREALVALVGRHPDLSICGQAEDAASALAGVARHAPDVAIVDLSLHVDSGLDLIKAVLKSHPLVAVIVLSIHEDLANVLRALRAGALGYVTKREATSQIIEAIRQVRSGRMYVNPSTLRQLAGRAIGPTTAKPQAAATLTKREQTVFRRLGDGRSTRQIATELKLSIKTVQAHCEHIKRKLGLLGASQLVREAVRTFENDLRAKRPPSGPS